MENAVVLYPSPLAGHLGSMVELGKLILTRHPSLSVTVLITTAPFENGSTAAYIHRISTTSSITFHHLPTISLPLNSCTEILDLVFELPRLHNPAVHQTLQTISQKSRIKAFILDFFCNAASEVSTNLDIPTYYFYTSGASALCAFLYYPTINETTTESMKDLDTYLDLPGLPPIHSSDFPQPLMDRSSNLYKNFINTATQMAKSSGIFTNTFEAFEPRAVKALLDGKCIPNEPTPPIYHIGPLVAANNSTRNGRENECLNWLNSQPSRGVVFLCFGSMGLFKKEQLKEMAMGLEKSRQRFLWVVRSPPADDENGQSAPPKEPDLDVLLPGGFLDRTKDKGLVVKNWAPQVDILSHDSVGGFVTHCGWNSTLEAVWAGVPMLAWPLYAEQKMNAVVLAEELKVALAVERSEDGSVRAEEVEKQVRELMEGETGKVVREQVLAMRESAKAAAIDEGGSSRIAFAKLTKPWIKT